MSPIPLYVRCLLVSEPFIPLFGLVAGNKISGPIVTYITTVLWEIMFNCASHYLRKMTRKTSYKQKWMRCRRSLEALRKSREHHFVTWEKKYHIFMRIFLIRSSLQKPHLMGEQNKKHWNISWITSRCKKKESVYFLNMILVVPCRKSNGFILGRVLTIISKVFTILQGFATEKNFLHSPKMPSFDISSINSL